MLLDTSKDFQQTVLDVLVLDQMLNTTKMFCKYMRGYIEDRCENTLEIRGVIKVIKEMQFVLPSDIISFYKSCNNVDKTKLDKD